MKLLMLSNSYPPVIRGGAMHVYWLSHELAKRGHQVTVCTIGEKYLPKYEWDGDVKIWKTCSAFQKIPFLFSDVGRHPPNEDWIIARQLRHILQEEKPDIVHSHGRIVYSMLSVKRKVEIPLVTTLHGYTFICPKTTLMNGTTICDNPLTRECISCGRGSYNFAKSFFSYQATKLNKNKLCYIDKFIAISSFVKKVHQKYLGLDENDITEIPNFYSREVNGEFKLNDRLPQDFILFVGALTPLKGVDILIKAYKKIQSKTKLVVIGASHKGIHYTSTENILVIENASRELLLNAYQNCRFAIFPSIWPEPFGIVVLEAMSYGKAVIASRTGGFIDIVADGETGILVPRNDSQSLADAIKYLLENRDIADKMGQIGYERWQQFFTPEVVVPKIEYVYQEIS